MLFLINTALNIDTKMIKSYILWQNDSNMRLQ